MPPLSPLSPFVIEEMRLSARTGAADDTEDLKHKWGFTPGAEDTLDVSHGEVLGSGAVKKGSRDLEPGLTEKQDLAIGFEMAANAQCRV